MDTPTIILGKHSDVDSMSITIAARLKIKSHRVWYNAALQAFFITPIDGETGLLTRVAYIIYHAKGNTINNIELRFV